VIHGGARSLKDNRDEAVPLLTPAGKSLEAIDDFIRALVGRRNAYGQLRGLQIGKLLRRSGP
jgi:hypothetical protein